MPAAAALKSPSYNRLKSLKDYAEARGKTPQTIRRRLSPELICYFGKTPFVDEQAADAALFRPNPRSQREPEIPAPA
jgi:hypothetical protein